MFFPLHHQSPYYFHQQALLSNQIIQTRSEDMEQSDDEDDDEDDRSSSISIETKPKPSASLIKHSIANILSNKVNEKSKRPFSSSSMCKLKENDLIRSN